MGTHPIFESDFDCLTELKMLSRLATRICRRPATDGVFQVKSGVLYTPPRFANSHDISSGNMVIGIGISVLFSSAVILCQLNNQKEMVATKEFIAIKYATLEESDTLLQMKLKATVPPLLRMKNKIFKSIY